MRRAVVLALAALVAQVPAPNPARAELQALLDRAAEYLETFQHEYGAVVAEEDYRQSMSGGSAEGAPISGTNVRLRSDLLLVKPAGERDWVCFRDVFEANGKAVRDRDERLKRLFLDPSPEARARLKAVKQESARYNVGHERNINVPLFALMFLERRNQLRFEFTLVGRENVSGLQARRVDYTEVRRPTITRSEIGDLPAYGSFLIDPATGAVIESRMQLDLGGGSLEFVVRYRQEAKLGLWVPADMREFQRLNDAGHSIVMEGRASYSNFRSFQVTTEEKIGVPK